MRNYQDLNETQQKFYDHLVRHRHEKTLKSWKAVIEQYLEYRKPFLVDAYHLKGHN